METLLKIDANQKIMIEVFNSIDIEELSKLDMDMFMPILSMITEEWCKVHGVYIVDFIEDFRDLVIAVDQEIGRYK